MEGEAELMRADRVEDALDQPGGMYDQDGQQKVEQKK